VPATTPRTPKNAAGLGDLHAKDRRVGSSFRRSAQTSIASMSASTLEKAPRRLRTLVGCVLRWSHSHGVRLSPALPPRPATTQRILCPRLPPRDRFPPATYFRRGDNRTGRKDLAERRPVLAPSILRAEHRHFRASSANSSTRRQGRRSSVTVSGLRAPRDRAPRSGGAPTPR
jgi:hypothetical protein